VRKRLDNCRAKAKNTANSIRWTNSRLCTVPGGLRVAVRLWYRERELGRSHQDPCHVGETPRTRVKGEDESEFRKLAVFLAFARQLSSLFRTG